MILTPKLFSGASRPQTRQLRSDSFETARLIEALSGGLPTTWIEVAPAARAALKQ